MAAVAVMTMVVMLITLSMIFFIVLLVMMLMTMTMMLMMMMIQMLAADGSMDCGTVDGSATMNFLKKGTKPVFRKLWRKIRYSRGLVRNATVGRERVTKGGCVVYVGWLGWVQCYGWHREGAWCI